MRKIVDASKTIEKNKIKTVKAGTEKYFINCIENLLVESRHKTNPLRKSVTSNRMTGTEQPAQILLPTTEIGGFVSIANALSTDTENHKDHTFQPTTVHLKQTTRMGHNDQNHFPIGSFNSGIDIT